MLNTDRIIIRIPVPENIIVPSIPKPDMRDTWMEVHILIRYMFRHYLVKVENHLFRHITGFKSYEH